MNFGQNLARIRYKLNLPLLILGSLIILYSIYFLLYQNLAGKQPEKSCDANYLNMELLRQSEKEATRPPNFQKLLSNLQEELKPVYKELNTRAKQVNWPIDDHNLGRWLDVASFNLVYLGKPLVEHIKETVTWREKIGACCIQNEEIYEHLFSPTIYLHGYDRLNRPIMIFQLKNVVASIDLNGIEKLLVYSVERAVTILKKGEQQRFTAIVDCEGLSFIPPVSHVRHILKLLKTHYPARLGRILVINYGIAVNTVWKVASLVLPERTIKKISFVDTVNQKEKLLHYIPEEELEKRYGGSSTFVYDRRIYVSKYNTKKKAAFSAQ